MNLSVLKGCEHMTVGDRIRKKRENLKISQKELADKIKIKKQTMNKYEMNIITNIPSDKIEELAKILECSPAYLMGWEDESSNLPEHTYNLNSKEELLLTDFRTLNEQGQDYILQTMDMVKDKYKKSNMLSDMEEIV